MWGVDKDVSILKPTNKWNKTTSGRGIMHSKITSGFTLLELLFTLTISVITLGIGVPVMGGIIDSNRVAGQINALRGALALTRSEAIRRNQQVVICKSVDGNNCTKRATWGKGWIVFEDGNHNRQRDTNEHLLLVQEELPNGHKLSYRGFGSHNYVVYRPTGITQMNGTFTLCAPNSPERSKALILMKTGRVRLSTTRADGSPLKCGSPVNSAS
jgi:type IV fimbrial biogenesis protein FimT